MNRIATILFCLSIFFSQKAYSQFYHSNNYKEGSGLPSSESYAVFQDSRGFVWIGTDNGVVKYDGQEFVSYNTANGLTDNTVFGFHEDQKGRIWFRTYNGALSYYENDTIRPYKYNAQLKTFITSAIIASIRYDSIGDLYFGTTAHCMAGKIDSTGKVSNLYGNIFDEDSIPTQFDEKGNQWWFFGFMDRIIVAASQPPKDVRYLEIEGKKFDVDLDDRTNQRNWLLGYAKWKGKYYFSVHKNIFTYDGTSVEKVYTSKEPLISLYVDREDRLWAGSFNNGAVMFTDSLLQKPFTLGVLSELSVSGVMQDYEGGMWLSTLDQGVFYFPNLTIRNYRPPDDTRVSSVVCNDHEIFIGNYSGDVFRLSDKGVIKPVYKGVAPVSLLFLDKKKNLWISDGAGTHIFETGVRILGKNEIDSKSFKVLIQAKEDYVIGANSMGIFKLSLDGQPLASFEGRRRPTSMAITDTDIYVGGVNGLEKRPIDFSGQTTTLTETRISALHSLDNRFIAVGTLSQGLFIYDAEKQLLTPIPLTGVVSIHSLTSDWRQRRLWIGTEKGLFQLEFSMEASKMELVGFSKADGLSSTKINNICRMGEYIWAVSDLGVSSVPLAHFGYHDFVPKFYINRILFENQAITTVGGAGITTTEEDMVIDVRPITFKGYPTLFRYRINEDKPWTMVSGGSIFLSDLKPDVYGIEIQASSGNSDWTEGITQRIEVMGHWWETWMFRLTVAMAVVLLAYGAYWLRIRAIRRKQKYLELINVHQQKLIDSEIQTQERERKRIASDLHDGIGASLSGIKMQINDALNNDNGDMSERAKEINENLTEVIDDVKRIVYDLHPPGLERYGLRAGLKTLVDRLNKTADLNVIFDYYGQREVVQPVSITIFRIIQELLNNTLKHARASEIRIHINEFDDEINIMYEDNGIGMIGSRFTGLGLHSIESRVRSLNGRMSWESNHKGTFYNFDIPF